MIETTKCIACPDEATREDGFCESCGPYYESLCSKCGEPGDHHIHCAWCGTTLPRTPTESLCETCQNISDESEVES